MPRTKPNFKLLWLGLALLLGASRSAPHGETRTKTFAATYARAEVPLLVVENSLGNITVHTHSSPEVRVEVLMSATKRTRAAADATLQKIIIEETHNHLIACFWIEKIATSFTCFWCCQACPDGFCFIP